MAKSEKSELGSNLTRREFLGTSLKIGLGAVGVAVAGVGCAPAATPQAAPATPTPQPAAATAAPKGPAVLEFWQIGQGISFNETMAEAIKEFEDTRNIKVNLNEQATRDLDTKVRPIFTDGGPGPDIVYTGSVYSLRYARMPFGFIDIAERVKAAGLKDKTPDSAWATMQEDGKVFGVPLIAFPFLLNYNKDLYEAAGIAGPPETWEDLLEVVNKIHDPSQDRFGFLNVGVFPAWLLEQLWYDSGVGYFEGSEDFQQYDVTKPITITKPEAIAALEYMRSLCETAPGGLEGNIGVGTGDADAIFAKGNLGNFYTHTIHTSQISDHNPAMVPQKNFDVAVFPKGSKRRGVLFSTSVLGISKLSKNPDAAWEFVKFLSDEWEGFLAPAIGCVPVRQDVGVDENAVGSWIVPKGREFLAADAFPQSFFPQSAAFLEPLVANVDAYFLGEKTAEQALEDTAAEAKKTLAG